MYLEHLKFRFLDVSNLISGSLFHKKAYPKYLNPILSRSLLQLHFQPINGVGWRSTIEGTQSSCRVRTNERLRCQNHGVIAIFAKNCDTHPASTLPIHIASLASLGHRQNARRIKADLKREVANQLIVSSSVPQPLQSARKLLRKL